MVNLKLIIMTTTIISNFCIQMDRIYSFLTSATQSKLLPDDAKYYSGYASKTRDNDGMHEVKYNDGDQETLRRQEEI